MDLQVEYDNGAKVPEYPAIMAAWERAAADFRAGHPQAELGVPYGPSERQAMDIFRPGPGDGYPWAVFIHGGYWQRAHRHYFSHLAQGMLAHGVAVAMPSYDLCPQVSMTEIVDQARAATAFVARRISRKPFVTGHSAGGHLTAMVLAAGGASAGLAISGLFDLPPLLATTVAGPLGMDAAEARRLSPLFLPSPGLPIHAAVGGLEGLEYTRQSRSIAEAWGGTWESLAGLHHFSIAGELARSDSPLTLRAVGMAKAG
jgi:arylformamidase